MMRYSHVRVIGFTVTAGVLGIATVESCAGWTIGPALDSIGRMIPEKVSRILEDNGLAALEYEPGSTPTAQMAAARVGVTVGQIAKSILLVGKDGQFRMVILPGDRKLSSAAIKRETGFKHSMTSAEQTEQVTGFRPGGVCPFGVEVEIFVDEGLKQYDRIFPAAGTSASAVPMTFDQLVTITGAKVCALTD